MAEKLRAFRWLGSYGASNDRKGALHIDRPDDGERPRRVIRPGDLVKDVKNLAVLGSVRIAELVKNGEAEYLDLLEKMGVEELLGRDKVQDDSSQIEAESADSAATEAAKMNIGKAAIAANQDPTDARITGASMGTAGPVPAAAPPASMAPPSVNLDDVLPGAGPSGGAS